MSHTPLWTSLLQIRLTFLRKINSMHKYYLCEAVVRKSRPVRQVGFSRLACSNTGVGMISWVSYRSSWYMQFCVVLSELKQMSSTLLKFCKCQHSFLTLAPLFTLISCRKLWNGASKALTYMNKPVPFIVVELLTSSNETQAALLKES